MKVAIFVLVLSLAWPVSWCGSLSDFMDRVRNVTLERAGGKGSPFAEVIQRGLEVFKFDDWRERLGTILEEKAGDLSKRGMQEFEDAMNDLRVLKDDPDASKDDFREIIRRIDKLA